MKWKNVLHRLILKKAKHVVVLLFAFIFPVQNLVCFVSGSSDVPISKFTSALTPWEVAKELEFTEEDHGYDFFKVPSTFKRIDIFRTSEFSREVLEDTIIKSAPKSLRKGLSKYLQTALKYASKYEIDPFWVLAVMWTESHFNNGARSCVNATGLMQIMPKTGQYLTQKMKKPLPYDLAVKMIQNPEVNIEMGIFYLKQLLKLFNHNYRLATVAYNMGPSRVKYRLRRKISVGTRHRYLKRVTKAYRRLTKGYAKLLAENPMPYRATFVYKYRKHKVQKSSLNNKMFRLLPEFPKLFAQLDVRHNATIL